MQQYRQRCLDVLGRPVAYEYYTVNNGRIVLISDFNNLRNLTLVSQYRKSIF